MLDRGERGRITPKVMHDCVELNLPIMLSRKGALTARSDRRFFRRQILPNRPLGVPLKILFS